MKEDSSSTYAFQCLAKGLDPEQPNREEERENGGELGIVMIEWMLIAEEDVKSQAPGSRLLLGALFVTRQLIN